MQERYDVRCAPAGRGRRAASSVIAFPAVALAAAGLFMFTTAAGCGRKGTPAPGPGHVDPEPGATKITAPVTRYGPSDRELLMFLPRTQVLGRTPPPGTASLPDAGEGRLVYGAIRAAGRGPSTGSGPAGGIPFAVSVTPAKKAGEGTQGREEEEEEEEEVEPWRLYVDRDLDRELADERPMVARPQAKEQEILGRKVRASAARFPAVEVVLPGGGTHAYSIMVLAAPGAVAADIRSAVGLAAGATLFGRKAKIYVYDSNVNGRFGDLYRSPYVRSDDNIMIVFEGEEGAARPRPLARRVLLDRRAAGTSGSPPAGGSALRRTEGAAAISVSEDGRALVIEELEVRFGSMARAGAEAGEGLDVQLSSPDYGLIGPVSADEVPEGEHRLVGYRMRKEGEGGGEWTLGGSWLTQPPPTVAVTADGPPVEVKLGPPLEAPAALSFVAGEKRVLVRVALRGSGGEEVTAAPEGGKPALGSFRIVYGSGDENGDKNGDELGSGKLRPHPLLPGLWIALWEPPRGGEPKAAIKKGAKLAIEASFEVGPFAEGFEGRTTFEFGRSTAMTLVVTGVDRGTQAETAGLLRGDVIVSYDGAPVRNEFDMQRAVRAARGKESVELVVKRSEAPGGPAAERAFTLRPGRIGVQVVPIVPGARGR